MGRISKLTNSHSKKKENTTESLRDDEPISLKFPSLAPE